MTRLETIRHLAREYDRTNKPQLANLRLKELVEQYPIEEVAAASGLAASSIVQYITRTNNVAVSWRTVIKAETVLSQV